MIKEFIGAGSTVEEATAVAKAGLNAPALANINVEVIAMPKKKFLGLFGGHDAQVKVWYDDGVKEKKPQPKKEAPKKEAPKKAEKKPQAKKEAKNNAPKKKEQAKETVEISAKNVDVDYAVSYLKNILKGLNVEDAQVEAKLDGGVLHMEIKCADYGIIIGRRGETLDSIQYLVSLALKKGNEKSVRVNLNVGNYREKREETLKNLAKKNASYVLRTGRRFTFEPMNPYERRIIHTTVQEIEGVESLSVGYAQERKVVLQPVGGVKPRQKNAPAKRAAAPKADRSDLPKFGKIEVKKD